MDIIVFFMVLGLLLESFYRVGQLLCMRLGIEVTQPAVHPTLGVSSLYPTADPKPIIFIAPPELLIQIVRQAACHLFDSAQDVSKK